MHSGMFSYENTTIADIFWRYLGYIRRDVSSLMTEDEINRSNTADAAYKAACEIK